MDKNRLIGRNIKYLRMNYGLNQHDMGKILEVKNKTISAYESGAITPSNKILKRLSERFHVTLDRLMTEDISVSDNIGNMLVADLDFEHYTKKANKNKTFSNKKESILVKNLICFEKNNLNILDVKCNDMLSIIESNLLTSNQDIRQLLKIEKSSDLEYEKFKLEKLLKREKMLVSNGDLNIETSHRLKFLFELIDFVKTNLKKST